ncbi:erythromycin esterase family protein [Butyrivibrio sp. X503]|uniref:erythromycin esterase family protein n=1 Tax=Butyrivibrio sp. X503 TaxID=2364878 RepID=UPI000EA98B5E|nr:erythromycin esterase family protein [Butyrivibrio sp. X503]RKM54871.1 erythromycin esterase family protein [Butyrivibrio sp. X503]
MKVLKVLKKIGKVLLIIVLVISLLLVVGLNYKTVLASHKNKDVVAAAKSLDDINVPDNVKIFGLGEASHGAVEFQESKLDVLKILVEKHGFKAIAIEADFGTCLEANAYIQGADGDSRDIVNKMDFAIYHTQQMADLLDWMRDYNQSVPEEEHLRFYGFDMQYPTNGVEFLYDYMDKNGISGIDTSYIEKYIDVNRQAKLTDEENQKVKDELAEIKAAIENAAGSEFDFDTTAAIKVAENTMVNVDWSTKDIQSGEMSNFRDESMAENVTWILNLEKEIGSGKIMLAAHNGHIGKVGQNILVKETMGGFLKEKYGDSYYSLGTDFFKGTFNSSVIRTSADDPYMRKNYYVTTADPMAYQAKYMEDKKFYLDFENLSPEDNKAVYDLVHSNVTTGSVGEGFYGLGYLIHASYRINIAPTELYDGMLFYYSISPIDPVVELD